MGDQLNMIGYFAPPTAFTDVPLCAAKVVGGGVFFGLGIFVLSSFASRVCTSSCSIGLVSYTCRGLRYSTGRLRGKKREADE